MKIKHILIIVSIIILLFSSMSAIYSADIEIVRDFDNSTIYHAEKSDYGSQKVSGIENNAKLVTTGTGSQKTIETENGYYEYSFLSDENNVRLNSTDKVKFNYNRTLTANYEFYPFMFAEINIIDLHGHTGSDSNYPAMKTASDSITKAFKEYTDVEEGYRPLYILDIDTNTKYQPGDKFTITYQDVVNTGMTKIIKTFQYVYAKDIVIENIIVENKTIENITYVNKTIEVPIYVNKTIENITYVNKTIENITYVNKTIEVPICVNKTIEVPIYVNKTIEVPIYVNKTIEVPIYVNKTIENITYVNKTVEIPIYVNKTIEIPKYVTKIIEIPIYVTKIIEIPEVENKTVIEKETKDIENVTEEIEDKEEIKNIPEIVPVKEVINEPVKQVANNVSVIQNNENKTIKVLNNNTTKTNTTTTNINDENNTSTPTSNNIKTIKMKETGTPIAWLMAFVFIIALATFAIRDKE